MAGDGAGIELALELGLELGLGQWLGLGLGIGLGLARTCCDASLFSEGAEARELLRPSTPLGGGAAAAEESQKSPRALDSGRSAASAFASASVALVTAAGAAGVAGVAWAMAATCRARARAAASAEEKEPRPLPAPSANDLPSARAWYLRLVAAQEPRALARGGKWLNRLNRSIQAYIFRVRRAARCPRVGDGSAVLASWHL